MRSWNDEFVFSFGAIHWRTGPHIRKVYYQSSTGRLSWRRSYFYGIWKWSERENDGVDFIAWSWPEAKESIGDPHGFDGAGGISWDALHFLYREQFASSPLVDSGVEVTEKSVSWNRAQGRWPGWWKVSGWSWWDVHLWCFQSHWKAQVGDKLIFFQLEQKFYFDLSELQHLMKPSQEHVFKGMWTWEEMYEWWFMNLLLGWGRLSREIWRDSSGCQKVGESSRWCEV